VHHQVLQKDITKWTHWDPCPEVEMELEVEDRQELEIKHLDKGTKIGNNTKFLCSSKARIVNIWPRRKWLILECTCCL
jgi:hypothetical protein